MALKRKTKVTDSFSMASMTDVIFLLLIFFLVTSTIVAPNVIKVSLPSAAASTADNQQNYSSNSLVCMLQSTPMLMWLFMQMRAYHIQLS